METLKVQQGEKYYLLYHLTNEVLSELKNDSEKLKTYFNDYLHTQQNICILEDEKYTSWPSPLAINQMDYSNPSSILPSTSLNDLVNSNDLYQPSTSSNTLSKAGSGKNFKFTFLCGRLENQILIYGVKFADHEWHYFDEIDVISTEHDALGAEIFNPISRFDKVRKVTVNLNETQSRNYFCNGKFIFKNKVLRTSMEITGKPIGNKTCKSQSSEKTTRQLVFASGETNPFLFLKDFENCQDIKNDYDKSYKILEFVDECHKGEFTKLFFNSDWVAVKSYFRSVSRAHYTVQVPTAHENKKRELSINFDKAESLRSFFERKLISLSRFTSLPFINQLEMVMNEIPSEISSLLIVNGMMTASKSEILNFCDTIQDLVEHECHKPEERPNEGDRESNPPSNKMQMEIFKFTPEMSGDEPMELDSLKSSNGRGRGQGRGRGRGVKGGGSFSSKGVVSGTVKKKGRP